MSSKASSLLLLWDSSSMKLPKCTISRCSWLIDSYKAGLMVIGFWNAYNVSLSDVQTNSKVFLYTIFACCFVLRIVDFVDYTKNPDDNGPDDRILSYDLLACLAPLLCIPLPGHTKLTWDCRQLLYLDFFRFFGTMLVVLRKMIQETAVFFLLLIVIVAGFLQSFFAYVSFKPR